MKIVKSNFRKGFVRLKTESMEDLWYLTHIISVGDLVKGKTTRKIEKVVVEGSTRNIKKKTVILKIKVKKVDFHKSSDILRVSGVVFEALDDIPAGVHHTISITTNSEIAIEKESFLNYQKKYIKDASERKQNNILLVALDRGDASFALLRGYGYDLLGELHVGVAKKDKRDIGKGDFYKDFIKALENYNSQNKIDKIVLGSPAFWKKEVYERLNPELKQKTILVSCNSAGEVGLNEIVKRTELKTVLKEDRVNKEILLVDGLLGEIGKDGAVVYGYEDSKHAANIGAVLNLLVTTKLIKTLIAENKFVELDEIMKKVESGAGEVSIINSEHDGGCKLDGLGSIGAILRYKLNY